MEDQELLAAIGQVVVNAAVLEYQVAVLVAVIEGRAEERARELAASTGEAMRALKKLAAVQEAPAHLRGLYRDARAVLDDRHVLAHSIAMVDMETDGAPGYSIWNPRRDADAPVTVPQLLEHAQDIRIVTRRAQALIT
jgi:hypothetical protein